MISLPVILKHDDFEQRKVRGSKSVMAFVDQYFGIFPFLEFMNLSTTLPQCCCKDNRHYNIFKKLY
jgi:hypothetical protein